MGGDFLLTVGEQYIGKEEEVIQGWAFLCVTLMMRNGRGNGNEMYE